MAVVEVILKTIDQSSGSLTSVGSKLGKLALSYGAVVSAATTLYNVTKQSVAETLNYANSVRTLSLLSGASTEQTSRFIQVLDDYKISTESAMTATRALTKAGHIPSIETLAELSDEYLSLNSNQERNEFLLKNLGRTGLQWVEVMNKGSKALLAQGAAVEQSLILSQKAVDQAREYEVALDRWNDSVEGLKISYGTGLLPILTDAMEHITALNEADKRLREEGIQPETKAWYERRQELIETIKKEQEAADAAMLQKGALDENTLSAQANAEALVAVTAKNTELLGLIEQLQGAEDSYGEKVKTVTEDVNLSEDERRVKLQELEAEHNKATNQIILNLMQQKLAADGILTDDEVNWLLAKGKQWGIYSDTVITEAQKAIAEANEISAAINRIPDAKTFFMTIQGIIDAPGYQGGARASGGPVTADTPYIVGERGPELFVPSQSGSIVPNNRLGGGMVLNVNVSAVGNPDPEGLARQLAPAIRRVMREERVI